MSNRDELLALLGEISLLHEDLNNLKNDLSSVRRDVTRIEKAIKAMLGEAERLGEGESSGVGTRDFDIIAVGKSKSRQERIKSVRDVIRELEREEGAAQLDKIVERASALGFDKERVEADIDRLLHEGELIEPVPHSGTYRLT